MKSISSLIMYIIQLKAVNVNQNNSNHLISMTKNINEVNKTELGSSAWLVTVLTTVLCYVVTEGNNLKVLRMTHNLSQVPHCKVQGEIGGMFDVATVTYGPIIYQRFQPAIIPDLPVMVIHDVNKYYVALKSLIDDVD